MSDYIHLQETRIGHPWNVAEIVTDVVVYRFCQHADCATEGNTVAAGQWRHAMTAAHFKALTFAEKHSMASRFGQHVFALTIAYGEIVGVAGWDVTFLPDQVTDVQPVTLF